jgi:sec-independent protein translocase protein TatC
MSPDADADPDGPTADEPMTLSEHLEELRRRMLRGLVWAVLAACVCYYFHIELTALILLPVFDGLDQGVALQTTNPTEGFFTIMKIVIVSALFLAGPLILLEAWQFVATGLYSHERRGVQIYAPFSFLLFLAGGLFAHQVMVPIMLKFLLEFGLEDVQRMSSIQIDARPRFEMIINLVLGMAVAMGLVFQLPLIMMFTQKIGVVTWRVYTAYRRHFIMGALILAAVLTPTGDPVSLAITMAPILFLFEGGILLCRMTESRKRALEENE